MVYPKNSSILITEIEETTTTSNKGLQCITDNRPCCQTPPNRHGEWIFPNRSYVPGIAQNPTSFFRNRGDDGTVNLNRLNSDVMMPTGRFCCVVPDATSVNQTVCANIGKLTTTEISLAIIINTYLEFPYFYKSSVHYRSRSHYNHCRGHHYHCQGHHYHF